MKKATLIAVNVGVSKAGNRYGTVTLRVKGEHGSRVKDIFVAPEVAEKVLNMEDSDVYVSAELNDFLGFDITDIRPVPTATRKEGE